MEKILIDLAEAHTCPELYEKTAEALGIILAENTAACLAENLIVAASDKYIILINPSICRRAIGEELNDYIDVFKKTSKSGKNFRLKILD